MAACAAQGRYWWMQPDGTFYGSPDSSPATEGDVYLLEASPRWVAQWDDWAHAAAAMGAEGLFARLQELINPQ